MIKSIPAALTALVLAAPLPAHATGKKPSPSQQQYDRAIAKAQGSFAQKQRATAGAVAGGGSGTATTGGDSIDGSWGFSYTDIPASTPQGVIGADAAILSDAWKIGPLGGHASQDLRLTPDGLLKLSAVLRMASQHDGTPGGRAQALDVAAVICAKDPDLARVRFGDGKCEDLGSLFPSLEPGE